MKDDNFDLVLAIPCGNRKGKMTVPKAESFLEVFSDSPLKYKGSGFEILNIDNNKSNLLERAKTFCEQIEKHRKYELIFNDELNNIETKRNPLAFGQVILYKDEIDNKFIPECCYNFFAVHSELSVKKLSVKKDSSFNNHTFNIIYFVVPDINYHDLTLLMDQSHELWCNIMGNIDSQIVFTKYLKNNFGYKYFGKIYHIIFSDLDQYEAIIDGEDKAKLFNILAAEEYKDEDKFSHQIELSESTNEYIYSGRGKPRNFILTKKEKFFDDYNMYSSYRAYASTHSYYYIINEEDKATFAKRISSEEENENFSSEGNILFVLENEIFKITACLVSSMEIYEQINNPIPDMVEIQNMFRHFINTRPMFEKLNYRYLGAQKEADFIYEQFRISDMLADYDRKRELLKNYCEVNNSILSNRNSIILSLIGLLFAFITGWDTFSSISKNTELIVPAAVCLFIVGILIKNIHPVKHIKRFFKIN